MAATATTDAVVDLLFCDLTTLLNAALQLRLPPLPGQCALRSDCGVPSSGAPNTDKGRSAEHVGEISETSLTMLRPVVLLWSRAARGVWENRKASWKRVRVCASVHTTPYSLPRIVSVQRSSRHWEHPSSALRFRSWWRTKGLHPCLWVSSSVQICLLL